jgi:hypothetical protein
VCYAELHEEDAAKEELLRAIRFGLKNDAEVEPRYRVGVLYFVDGGFAQAKRQLESILETHLEGTKATPSKLIYYQLSRVCHYLGEKENARRYTKLAQDSAEAT